MHRAIEAVADVVMGRSITDIQTYFVLVSKVG